MKGTLFFNYKELLFWGKKQSLAEILRFGMGNFSGLFITDSTEPQMRADVSK